MSYRSQARRNANDITRTPEWRSLDAQLLRQIVDDVDLIAEQGIGDFLLAIQNPLQAARQSLYRAQQEGRFCTLHDTAQLATRLGWPERTALAVVAWNKFRQPLREVAREVREEAERIRHGLARSAKRKGGAQ